MSTIEVVDPTAPFAGAAKRDLGLVDHVEPLFFQRPPQSREQRLLGFAAHRTSVARNWLSADARLDKGVVSAAIPAQRPLVFFITIRDSRGAVVSTPHVELSK